MKGEISIDSYLHYFEWSIPSMSIHIYFNHSNQTPII